MKSFKWAAYLIAALFLASCGAQRAIIPQAVNTMNIAELKDLHLAKGDYEIFNTITAEATVYYETKGNSEYMIEDKDGEFKLECEWNSKTNEWEIEHSGVLNLGFFGSDYIGNDTYAHPESIVRRVAIYRAINLAKEYGADAFIEPTISTNVERLNKKMVAFKSTVVAKLMKINTTK